MRPGHALRFAIVLVVWLAGCGGPVQPRLTPLPPDALILAFGDSLTFGSGAAPDESYPAQLAALSARRVINAGVPGELSGTGLARLPRLLDQHRPALVILCHGGNDLLSRHDSAGIKARLHAMVQLIRTRGAQVLLVGVPRPALFGLDAADLYVELAEELGLAYEGAILARIESDPALKSDQIHPNARGYRLFAEAVHGALVSARALAR
jgi:lysophospholipase L1-like esterase